MTDVERLLNAARSRRLTTAEVESLVAALEDPDFDGDRYSVIHALGKGAPPTARVLLEHELEDPTDPMVARIALQTLCSFWGLSDLYRDEVLRFLTGVEWDEDRDVQQMAASIAGEMLRNAHDAQLLRVLLELFDNTGDEDVLHADAYFALCRAMGRDWSDLPPAGKVLRPASVDYEVVSDARERLRSSEA